MKLLLPYDGSAGSRAALDFIAARSALAADASEVTVVFVQQPLPARARLVFGKASVLDVYATVASKTLAPALRALKDAGLRVRHVSLLGHAAERIARTAAANGSDLIVMGSHGRRPVLSALLGSVASGVLARVHVPVLLVRKDAPKRPTSLRVGLALDDSRYSAAALRFVIEQHAVFGARASLHLAHVVEPLPAPLRTALTRARSGGVSSDDVKALQRRAFERVLAPARRLLSAAALPASETMLVADQPGDALAAWAARERLGLLVLGTHGRTALRAALLGSVAMRAAARCSVPLLLVPTPARTQRSR
jgi:nucleotide-binding universal stress UspA family protein